MLEYQPQIISENLFLNNKDSAYFITVTRFLFQLIATKLISINGLSKQHKSRKSNPKKVFLNTNITFTYICKAKSKKQTYIPEMEAVRSLVDKKPLVIFSKSSCCVSHSTKQLMSSYGANATVYELDEIPNGKEVENGLMSMGCKPSVPAIFIGNEYVGGSNEILSLQVQGKLVPKLIAAGAIWVWK